MTYKTDILTLRPWFGDDVENLYRYAKNPQVGSATGKPAHTNILEKTFKFLCWTKREQNMFHLLHEKNRIEDSRLITINTLLFKVLLILSKEKNLNNGY